LLLPLSLRGSQLSIAFEGTADEFRAVSVRRCGFMRMRGPNSGPERKIDIDTTLGLRLLMPEAWPVDPAAVRAALAQPAPDVPTGVRTTMADLHDGLDLWLALHPGVPCQLVAAALPETVNAGPVPRVYEWKNPPWHERIAPGELGEYGLVTLARVPDDDLDIDDPTPVELFVRPFGAVPDLADRVAQRVRDWDRAGRPSAEALVIRAYPAASPRHGADAEVEIAKDHYRLALGWSGTPATAR
jgi:protein-L-isoaspartate(D-aspartate) O-methyltransferase